MHNCAQELSLLQFVKGLLSPISIKIIFENMQTVMIWAILQITFRADEKIIMRDRANP